MVIPAPPALTRPYLNEPLTFFDAHSAFSGSSLHSFALTNHNLMNDRARSIRGEPSRQSISRESARPPERQIARCKAETSTTTPVSRPLRSCLPQPVPRDSSRIPILLYRFRLERSDRPDRPRIKQYRRAGNELRSRSRLTTQVVFDSVRQETDEAPRESPSFRHKFQFVSVFFLLSTTARL